MSEAVSDVAAIERAKLRAMVAGMLQTSCIPGRSVSADAWRGLDVVIRRLLVTLAGLADESAVKDWREFNERDRIALGTAARFLANQLKGAAALLW